MSAKQGKHGGAGRGQGRKPLHEAAMKPVSIKMTDDQKAKLDVLGGAPWVRKRIDRAKVPDAPIDESKDGTDQSLDPP